MPKPKVHGALIDRLAAYCRKDDGSLDPSLIAQVLQQVQQSANPDHRALARQFQRHMRRLWRAERAIVTSAIALDETTQQQIATVVHQLSPKMKTLLWQTDPTLVGGLTVLAGDQWLNLSVQAKLAQLKECVS